MAIFYEIHVDGENHFKFVGDADANEATSYDCQDGQWVRTDVPLPVPTDLVEDGPGAGPTHCPVCSGDVISTTFIDE